MSRIDYLSKFAEVSALVVGDLMLDEYIFGSATRVSQEAPVLVIKQNRVSSVPGGAANVAMNIMALGSKTGILGVIGDDAAATILEDSLKISGIFPVSLQRDPSRPTTKKTRVVANHSHQVVRVDIEVEQPISDKISYELIENVRIHAAGRSVILLSDYQKGSLPAEVIQRIIALGAELKIPVVANAKPGSIQHYQNASLVSLNRFEASTAVGVLRPITDEEAPSVAAKIREKYNIDSLVVTLGGSGMVSASAVGIAKVPAIRVEVYDEAGAGDTVIATLALCAASGPINEDSLRLATHTAAAVVRKVGVAVPSQEDLVQIANVLN
jgi:D-glycero-beta-D-manno-heptose-7-phosphate kinase